MQKIYLDYAATTPMDKEVVKAMEPYFSDTFGNPSSIHQFGQESLKGMDQARENIAKFFNSEPSEVVFTSGATEANNLALKGVIYAHKGETIPHLITSQIEHPCVLNTARWLEQQGLAEVSYLPINQDGLIELDDLKKAIKSNTVLVSIMYVNNEIGTIQPIKEIGELLKEKNIIFHTDAVQAINYLNCDVQDLGVDLLSFSGHKIYGPKGIGALIVKQGTKLTKIQHGGEQENHFRAGTHNVPAIIGLAKAVELIKSYPQIKELRDYLWQGLQKIDDISLNGTLDQRIENNLNVSFNKVEGEGVLMSLDLEGIAASSGSACASGSLESSHVILALTNKDHLRSHASIRFTLGKDTKKEDIDYLLQKLPDIITRLRKISPFK